LTCNLEEIGTATLIIMNAIWFGELCYSSFFTLSSLSTTICHSVILLYRYRLVLTG
jgi:hypothetical protein